MANNFSRTEIIHRELHRFNTNYYRDKFRRLAVILFLMVIINAILVCAVGYLYFSRPKDPDRFYASNTYNGVVTRLYPLSSPVMQPARLLDWAGQAVIAAYAFNFTNYRGVFSQLQKFFTSDGWKEYNTMLQDSRILDTVINKKLFMSAVTSQKPILITDGVIDGHYAWTVQVPILVTYKLSTADNGIQQTQQAFNVTVIIMRIPNIDNPEEIAINHFTVS
jgi:intracellular multiplication protein IcmL